MQYNGEYYAFPREIKPKVWFYRADIFEECDVVIQNPLNKGLYTELNLPRETTEDGLFTLENVACLGCCSLSPAMMINGSVYGTLTPDSARKIVAGLRQEAQI